MVQKHAVVLCAVISLASGCKENAPPHESATQLGELLRRVPEDAVFVFAARGEDPLWQSAIGSWGKGPKWKPYGEALDRELGDYLDKRVGINLKGVRAAVAFLRGIEQPQGAVIVTGVQGTLKGKAEGERIVMEVGESPFGGGIIAVQKGTTLAFGSADAVRAAIDDTKDKAAGVADEVAEASEDIIIAAAGEIGAIATQLEIPIPLDGLKSAMVHHSASGVTLRVNGSAEALDQVKQGLDMLFGTARAQMAEAKAAALEGDSTVLGLLAIYQDANTRYLLEEIAPQDRAGGLEFHYPIEAMPVYVVAIAGILAAVAVPAFMKYIKKSKTTEARMFLRMLTDGVDAYVAENGRLPLAAPITPPLGDCCGDGCDPRPEQWGAEPWRSLVFSVADKSYYSYELATDGNRLSARAFGDLDCDGVYSTFSYEGAFDSTAKTIEWEGVFIENELE